MRKQLLVLITALLATNILAQKDDGPGGKLSGIIFGDYYYNAARDTGFTNLKNKATNGAKDVHGLQLRRIYFTYDYRFSSKFSSRVRLESDEANFTASSSNSANKFGMFVKDAFVKWNVIANHALIIGIQGGPAFEISEGVWGHRFLEKTILDLRGIVPSRDMAISLKGQIDSSGVIKYWLMYGNNSAGKPESDKYKRFYGHVEVTPVKNLSITAYADYQTKVDITNPYDANKEVSNNILTVAFFIGYKAKDKYSAGIETYYNQVNNGYNNTTALLNKTGIGMSVFGSYIINPKLAAIGRFDYFEPNGDANAKGDTRNWFIAGLTYKPAEIMIISPNVILETYEDIGDTEIKSSVTPRLSFSWTF